jgi:hypothetical protein
MPVARQIVLQVARRDIGQLTDIAQHLMGHGKRRPSAPVASEPDLMSQSVSRTDDRAA